MQFLFLSLHLSSNEDNIYLYFYLLHIYRCEELRCRTTHGIREVIWLEGTWKSFSLHWMHSFFSFPSMCTHETTTGRSPLPLALLAVLSLKHPTMLVAFPRSRAQCQLKSSSPTRLPDSSWHALNFLSQYFYCREHDHGGSVLLTLWSGNKYCVWCTFSGNFVFTGFMKCHSWP